MELRAHQIKALDLLRSSLGQGDACISGERWKLIAGLDRYMISDSGRVFSAIRSCRILSPTKTPQGYPYVSLMLDGKARKFTIHKLVALAFVENPLSLPVVNHKDGIKENNHYSNLEWCTYRENNDHARDNGLVHNFGEHHYAAKLTESDVRQIRQLLSSGLYHKDIANQFGVNRQQITKIANGQAWRRS